MKGKLLYAVLAFVLVLSALGGIVSFRSVDNASGGNMIMEYAKSSFKRFSPSDEFVKAIGRTHYSDEKRYISMSGSGVEFVCKGSYVYITVLGDNAKKLNKNQQPRIAIYKNGELIIDDIVNYDKKKYHIDIDDAENETVIKLIKLSEAMFSGFYIDKIGAFCKGNIVPTEDKDVKIEFIGDSITCGYGIDSGNIGGFSTRTENFAKTYAYLTAEKLNADYSAIAFSGYGVVSGFTSDGRINKNDIVSRYYDKSALYFDGGQAYWNFIGFEPNFVVINLGTNDASYCTTAARRDSFREEYIELIKTVREKNTDTYILCVLGDMNNSLYPYIEEAVSEYKLSEKDYRVKAFTIDFKMGENEIVIDGHPGADSNIIASEVLTQEIQKLIKAGFLQSIKE